MLGGERLRGGCGLEVGGGGGGGGWRGLGGSAKVCGRGFGS